MKKILIVDDEKSILTGLSRTLKELCGFHEEVRTVVNGREAIHEASCCSYNVCFLDIMLPDINGLVVLEDIHKVSPQTKIVLMSARYTSDEFQKIAEDRGALHIEKPFDLHKIKHVTKRALEGNHNYDAADIPARELKTKEKRVFQRTSLKKKVGFCLTDDDYINIICGSLDISNSGIGIRTNYPLERGQTVFFNNGVSSKAGIVAWCTKDEENNFRAGLKFI